MISHHGATAVQALVAGLALLGLVAPPATAQRQIGVGKSVTDSVAATDPVLPSDRTHYKVFSFYGTAGQTVRIDLMSRAFDARLYLQDWEGQNIAEGEGGSSAPNARISYNLPFTGMYQVLVNARGRDQHGTFTLSVAATDAVALPPNANPPQLLTVGTIGFDQSVPGVLADGAPTYHDRKYDAYDFQCSAGQQFQMDVLSGWDNYAMVVDPGGNIVSRDNDSGGSTNARIVHTCATSGTYRLVVTTSTPAASAGGYTLRVQPHGAATALLAQRPPVAQPGPVARTQPSPHPQPVAQPQPVSHAEPAAPSQPVAQTQPVAHPVPEPPAQRPAPQPQPTVPAQTVAQAQPTPEPTNAAQPQRAVQPQPVVQAQPVPPPQPVSHAEPAAQTQPVAQTQPAAHPATEPAALPPAPPPQPPAQSEHVTQSQPVARPVVALPAPAPADAVPTGPIPEPGAIAQLALGQTRQGRLEPGDATVAGMFADTWQFQGSAGQRVTIDVTSSAFSTYVQLFDGNGNRLAEDGGSGGGNNSRLVYVLAASGTYQLMVVSSDADRAVGLYSISLR